MYRHRVRDTGGGGVGGTGENEKLKKKDARLRHCSERDPSI
jgi:hypothetical protein